MKSGSNILASFGINGSLRRREVSNPQSYTEYYLFNSAANLKAYSNNGLDFAYYGYNASNTRAYKLSMLNQNQWVNGQPEPLNLQLQNAMFYPNAYLNFNHNGEYTKHYYSGSERIASRLGENTLNLTTVTNSRLSYRTMQVDQQARADLLEVVEAGDVPIETPSVDVSALQTTGSTTDIFYYHTNHLGSTAFVTDQSQNVTQGFLYAPFGEITTEYNSTFGNDIIPKYSFNAKELDEETGMYYYEARYYKPPVFTSRDPMFEKYFWMTPYAYCANNPVKYVDPSGRELNPIFDWSGTFLGTDDKGLQGEAIIMDNKYFTQNMSHDDATKKGIMRNDLALCDFFSNLVNIIDNQVASFPNRPDWDGYLTLSEANDWYRNGNGQPLYVDESKIDLSPMYVGSIKEGESIQVNYASPLTPNLATGLVYGAITLTGLNSNGAVSLSNQDHIIDNYGFEMHPNRPFRNFITKIGEKVAGEGMPYDIYGYGKGQLKEYPRNVELYSMPK